MEEESASIISVENIVAEDYEVPFEDNPPLAGTLVNAEPSESSNQNRRSRLKSDRPEPGNDEASGKIPSVDEWKRFTSNVVLRVLTDWYIEWAFRGIDEDLISDREAGRIKLAEDERNRIARPFAEVAYKAKFTRKHGRMIIASGDTLDAFLQMGIWYSRVSRIAAKYRRLQRDFEKNGMHPQAPAAQETSENVPPPFVHNPPVNNQEVNNERSGQSAASANGHKRPKIIGAEVFSPGG